MTSIPSRPPAPAPAPAHDGADAYYDKCLVQDPGEVRRLLQRLVDGRCLLKVHAEGDSQSLLSAALRIDGDALWLDLPRSHTLAAAWLASPRLHCEGSIERIALRFGCGPARGGMVDGHPALALPVPHQLLHMQRREFLRREPPPDTLSCTVPARADGAFVVASIRDIGGGGLAVLAPEDALAFEAGDVFAGCVIELPQIGPVEVNLRVRHVVTRRQRGRTVRQAGCEFVDISPAAQGKLFRYIMQLERELLARRRGR